MTTMTLLVLLIAGHVLADFYFQPAHWIVQRNQRHFSAPCLYWHGAIHGLLAALILGLTTEIHPLTVAAYALLLGASHIVIDGLKSYAGTSMKAFVADQLAHLLVIGFIVMLVWQPEQATVSAWLKQSLNYQTFAVITGYLLVLRPVSIIIRQVLAPWSTAMEADKPAEQSETSLQAAGQNIGYLERVLVFTFILLNQFAAIGFLLAAKSVFRFGDLRQSEDKKLTEYVMLGTLTSFALTIAIGLLVSSVATELPLGK
ncbi:DUF3307 domain-containing protein [uncultured Alteromonas sp.]|uniref:DUF3307 domain-containing protein n=1 Tax=uncultured Alteromonas sp. TaxID=179113 RepID=UPI0025E5B9D7|nr:DUF3307 domain-containing protein [uncultured Alteromonas sp.]